MVFESFSAENVVSGKAVPRRITVVSSLTDGRTSAPIEFEYHEVPRDQIADDDIFMTLAKRRRPVVPEFKIGKKLSDMSIFSVQ